MMEEVEGVKRPTSNCLRIVTAVATLTISTVLMAQKVVRPWDNPCAGEKIQPNLELRVKQHVTGKLRDESGAPFVQSRILIEKFRDEEKFTTFKEVVTDDQGRFDFGVVSPGKYRFLPSPSRAFRQPKRVICDEGEVCKLNLTRVASSTDQAFINCPIQ